MERKLEAFNGVKPTISEHALLRYIERVMGFDLDALRRQIMTDSVTSIIQSLPNGRIPAEGCRLVVQNGTVVTVEAP